MTARAKLSRARRKLSSARSAAALLQGTSLSAPTATKNNECSKSLVDLTSATKSSRAAPTTIASSQATSDEEGRQRRRRSRPHVVCENEKALREAYKAAAELLGAAEGDLTLTPIPKSRSATAEELALGVEQALIARVKVLEAQIAAVEKKIEAVGNDATMAKLDRCLFNARCGLDLMCELAKKSRKEACEHAVEYMDARQKATTPSLVRYINDERLINAFPSTLVEADQVIDRHGRKGEHIWSFLSREQRPYVSAGAIF